MTKQQWEILEAVVAIKFRYEWEKIKEKPLKEIIAKLELDKENLLMLSHKEEKKSIKTYKSKNPENFLNYLKENPEDLLNDLEANPEDLLNDLEANPEDLLNNSEEIIINCNKKINLISEKLTDLTLEEIKQLPLNQQGERLKEVQKRFNHELEWQKDMMSKRMINEERNLALSGSIASIMQELNSMRILELEQQVDKITNYYWELARVVNSQNPSLNPTAPSAEQLQVEEQTQAEQPSGSFTYYQ